MQLMVVTPWITPLVARRILPVILPVLLPALMLVLMLMVDGWVFRRRSCCASQGASDDACGCGDGLVVGRFVDALSMETLVRLNARVAAGDFAGADGVDSRWAFACALVSLRICTCRSKNGRRERRSLRM